LDEPHSSLSLISAFGEYLVKQGMVSKDFGRLLNRGHEIRQIADYNGESVEPADAKEMVKQAAQFIETQQTLFNFK